MINELISLIKQCNSLLEEKIKKSNSSKKISAILSNIKNGEVSNQELDEFDDIISKLELSEADKKRVPFVLFLVKNKKKLDESQIGLLDNILVLVNKQEADSTLGSLLEKNNKIIDELSKDTHFDNFEDLILIFNELEGSLNNKIDNKFKLEVIREIISKNSKAIVTQEKTETIDSGEELYVEKEVREDQKMSEAAIKELLEKYDYSYDSLTNDNKKYLAKYAYKEKLEDVLNALKEAGIHIELNKPSVKRTFCKILVVSNSESIKEFMNLCSENSIEPMSFIDSLPVVLIPNTVRAPKPSFVAGNEKKSDEATQGVFGNFKVNLKYLSERKYNIETIARKCKKALTINPIILKYNLETLSDVYKIDMTDGKSFTGILLGTSIENLDRIIESTKCGYEYAKANNSSLVNITLKNLYQIRVADARGINLFYYENRKAKDANGDEMLYHALVKFSAHGKSLDDPKYKDDERLKILELSDGEVQRKFGQVIPDFVSDKEKSATYDVLVSSTKSERITITDNPYIKLLDSHYKVNEFLYMINTTLISRQKVLRVCQNLKDNGIRIGEEEIKYALSYNSILNEEDVKNISNFRFIRNIGGKK